MEELIRELSFQQALRSGPTGNWQCATVQRLAFRASLPKRETRNTKHETPNTKPETRNQETRVTVFHVLPGNARGASHPRNHSSNPEPRCVYGCRYSVCCHIQ